MSKLILSVIIILASGIIGFSYSCKYISRRKTIQKIITALNKVNMIIRFEGADVNRIISECFCSNDFKLINCDCLKNTHTHEDNLKKAVSSVSPTFCLSDGDKGNLLSFLLGIGTTDIEGQIKHTELYIITFSETLNLLKEEEPSKVKLYRILGISLGIALTLAIV